MAFTRKVPYGLDALKTWVTDSITTTKQVIQNWCNNRFSLIDHTHSLESLGCMRFPDYARCTKISLSSTYTTSEDGYVLINVSDPGRNEDWALGAIVINNNRIPISYYFGESHIYKMSNTGIFLPISKGSKLYIDAIGLSYDATFIPCK